MNSTLLINNANLSDTLREGTFSAYLFGFIGCLLAIPSAYSYYKSSTTRSPLALAVYFYIFASTLLLFGAMLFDFTSKISNTISIFQNVSELSFLLLTISNGTFQTWHKWFAIGYLFFAISTILMHSSPRHFVVFGFWEGVVGYFLVWNWILILWVNRKNAGSSGQRSGLLLFTISTFVHTFARFLYVLKFPTVPLMVLQALFLSFSTALSVHLNILAVKILERQEPYTFVWKVVWWKWLVSLSLLAVLFIVLYFQGIGFSKAIDLVGSRSSLARAQ